MQNAFLEPEKTLEEFDAGNFVYAVTACGGYRPGDFYWEAVIPKRYVENVWTKYFGFKYFVDDPKQFW